MELNEMNFIDKIEKDDILIHKLIKQLFVLYKIEYKENYSFLNQNDNLIKENFQLNKSNSNLNKLKIIKNNLKILDNSNKGLKLILNDIYISNYNFSDLMKKIKKDINNAINSKLEITNSFVKEMIYLLYLNLQEDNEILLTHFYIIYENKINKTENEIKEVEDMFNNSNLLDFIV